MEFEKLRELMVKNQIEARGITDVRVLEAMLRVPRHRFVPSQHVDRAYEDMPLTIGEGQTISQPLMVALMTQALSLKGEERVMEVGTGCGYQTAVLREVCREVYSIERIPALAQRAEELLKELNYDNIFITLGDGTLGWQAGAIHELPLLFDGIMVTAAAPDPMEHLSNQLKEGGRMVIPVGSRYNQMLMCVTKHGQERKMTEICACVFVPLIGQYGWKF